MIQLSRGQLSCDLGGPERTTAITDNEISKTVIGAAIEVHRVLGGPGLLESVYEEALCFEIRESGLFVERQKPVPLVYKEQMLHAEFRLDLLVERLVIVECKATPAYNPIFQSQALTYLRLLDLKLALVINFGEKLVKDGIHRVVRGL